MPLKGPTPSTPEKGATEAKSGWGAAWAETPRLQQDLERLELDGAVDGVEGLQGRRQRRSDELEPPGEHRGQERPRRVLVGAAHDGEGGDDGVGEGDGAALEGGGVGGGVRGYPQEVWEEGRDDLGQVGLVHVSGDELEAAEGAGHHVRGRPLADSAHEGRRQVRPLLRPVPLRHRCNRHADGGADLPRRVA